MLPHDRPPVRPGFAAVPRLNQAGAPYSLPVVRAQSGSSNVPSASSTTVPEGESLQARVGLRFAAVPSFSIVVRYRAEQQRVAVVVLGARVQVKAVGVRQQ